MGVAMPVESMRCTTEAAIGRAANFDRPPVGAADHDRNASGAAIASPHKTHRYRAGGRTTHHGQDHATGTFHGAALETIVLSFRHARLGEASESRFFHSIVRHEMPFASAAAGKMRRERMCKPAEAAARHMARA